jgi:hypothetical protein
MFTVPKHASVSNNQTTTLKDCIREGTNKPPRALVKSDAKSTQQVV